MTLLFSWMGFVEVVLWILLVVSTLLLIAVILLQEGKGGGLAEAFGGAGAETFGVKAHGINKFTAVVGAVFLGLCVVLVKVRAGPEDSPPVFPDDPPRTSAPPIPAPPRVPPSVPAGAGEPERRDDPARDGR